MLKMTLRVHGSGVGGLPFAIARLGVRNASIWVKDTGDAFGGTLVAMSVVGMTWYDIPFE
jgi:hypothetical protein